MPLDIFDESISSEELLEVRKSLMEIVNFFQSKSLQNITIDETVVFVPVRAQIENYKTDNQSFQSTLNTYQNYTLDKVEAGPSINSVKNFSEINKTSGNLPTTPEFLTEVKTETDSYLKVIEKTQGGRSREPAPLTVVDNADSAVRNFNPPQINLVNNGQRESLGKIPFLPETDPNKVENKFAHYMLSECIPCLNRAVNLSAVNPIDGLINILNDELDRVFGYLKNLYFLLFNDEVSRDICSLLEFLDFQCVPDLANLLGLLGLLVTKYTDIGNTNFNSVIGFITPIFSPMLSGLVGLLDQYMQLIIAPIDCIIDSLDQTLAKLDVQQGLKNFKEAQNTGKIRRINELEHREAVISGEIAKLSAQRAELNQRDNPDTSAVEKITLQVEKNTEALVKVRSQLKEAQLDLGPGQAGRERQETFAQGLSSGLRLLRAEILEGRVFVKSKLELVLTEVTKLLSVKSQSAFSSIEVSLTLQRLARVISFIRALIQFKSKGLAVCQKNNNPEIALGSFLDELSPPGVTQPAVPRILPAKDGEESVLVILPPDTLLAVTGEGETNPSIEDIKKYNVSGILPNIGNLANKEIAAIIPGTQIGMKPAVLPVDLCKNSGDSASLDKLKNWMTVLNG